MVSTEILLTLTPCLGNQAVRIVQGSISFSVHVIEQVANGELRLFYRKHETWKTAP